MTYFNFYNLEETFFTDKKLLRKAYLAKSRDVHPDLVADIDHQNSENTIDLAAYNNLAYTTLSDEMQTIKYILVLHDIQTDAKNAPMSSEFLTEMMELNENIMDAKMENNNEVLKVILDKINEISNNIQTENSPILQKYTTKLADNELHQLLFVARDYYLKMNYIKKLIDHIAGNGEL